MKRYLTKYALTEGVQFVEMEDCTKYGNGMWKFSEHGFAHRDDSQATRQEAVKRVAEMKAKKLASLRKQIAKLEKLDPEQIVPKES